MQSHWETVENNLGLVKKVLSKNWKKYCNTPLEDDLYHEGILGLYSAVTHYDESKNIEFSTYAFKCINNRIGRYYADKLKAEEEHARLETKLKDDLELGDIIEDEYCHIKQFENEYSLQQDIDKVFKCISKEDYEFLINFISSKYNYKEKDKRTKEDRRKDYRKYQKLAYIVKTHNRDYIMKKG